MLKIDRNQHVHLFNVFNDQMLSYLHMGQVYWEGCGGGTQFETADAPWPWETTDKREGALSNTSVALQG